MSQLHIVPNLKNSHQILKASHFLSFLIMQNFVEYNKENSIFLSTLKKETQIQFDAVEKNKFQLLDVIETLKNLDYAMGRYAHIGLNYSKAGWIRLSKVQAKVVCSILYKAFWHEIAALSTLTCIRELGRESQRIRDAPIGRGGIASTPIFSNSQEIWSKGSHAAREVATVFSVTFSFFSNNSWSISQNVPTQRKVSRHITAENCRLGAIRLPYC